MKNIIDDINTLINANNYNLDDLLLDDKYNKANLRELIRRLIYVIKGDKRHIKDLQDKIIEKELIISNAKQYLDGVDN